MAKIKSILLLAVFAFVCNNLFAQLNNVNQLFYHISEKDGLADNLVNCFFQDSRGIMWMGTQNGLSSFDGSEITSYRPGKTSGNNQLLSAQIYSITEDANQTLWIGTSNGLSSFNLKTKKITSWQYNGDNNMHGLACDGNKIWIASGYGVLMFDKVKQQFKHFENPAMSQPANLKFLSNACNALLLDSKKRLWIATVNGLWQFDIAKESFEQYDGTFNDPKFDGMVNTVVEDHQSQIWIGCWSGGLKKIMPATKGVEDFNAVKNIPGHIMSIVEQSIGKAQYKFWLSDFLTEFKPDDKKAIPNDLKPITEASALSPACLYVSRDNLLWIATVRGVYILDPARQLFKHSFVGGSENITRQNPALFEQDGNLWIGGDQNFALKKYNHQFKLLKDYTPTIKALKGPYSDNGLAVMNIKNGGNNSLYLGTTAGILEVNLNTDKINIVCSAVTDSSKRNYGFINNVLKNGDNVWCFPWRRGVWQLVGKSGKFQPLLMKLPEGSGKLKSLNLQDAVFDQTGNIWITDLDYGIVKYTSANKKFQRLITKDIPDYARAVNLRIVNNKLWSLVNTAVVTIDPKTQATRSWALPEGMNKYVYDFTDDGAGNIWIATRTGLIVFNTSNHSFNQYTEEDGLINNDMNGSLQKLSEGRMVYAGENFLTVFKPLELLHTPSQKKLLLTKVIAGDSDIEIANTDKLIIPPGNEKITFKWALINYTNPLQNRYFYKLEKIDKEWNYAGNQGKVEFNGLTPGSYKFKYKAVTADGLSGTEKVLIFTVQPNFWQTLWFRMAIFLMLIICVFLIIRDVRIKEQKKSAIQLQLSELEMKALRAQMNPHFIFNALNSIQECIVTKNTDTAYSYLSSFSKLVRMILENSEKQFITLADEVETLRLYLAIEKLRFDDTFEFSIKFNLQSEPMFIHLPAMILQPFVENALWHGLIQKKGDKKLAIEFEQEQNNLVCIITDNGIGRKVSNELKTGNQVKEHSMGIKITEERLKLLQTEASITITDLIDENGNGAGTKVRIKIPLAF